MTTTPIDRMPPHSVEAEEAVLGSILIDPEAIFRVSSFLKAEDFYIVKNQWVWDAAMALHERREPIDFVTTTKELEAREQLAEIGGAAYISHLINGVPTAIHAEGYGRIVERTALRRRLLNAASEIAQLAYEESEEIDGTIDAAEQALFGVSQRRISRDLTPISDAIRAYYDRIEYLYEHRGEPLGIPTGFIDLDKMLGGLQRSDLLIIAARPGVGKCVTGDTLILDPTTGALVEIQELVRQRRADLVTLDGQLKLRSAQAGDFLDDGEKPVYQVVTSLGRKIEVTGSHPFLTIEGWKSVSLLKPGDHVAVPRVLPVFGRCNAPEYEVKVLAYLLADGCLTGHTPQFTNDDPRLRADFSEAALKFPGTKVGVQDSKGQRTPTVHVSGDREFIRAGRGVFARQLKAALQQRQMPARQLAQGVDVNPSAVTVWLQSKSAPDREHFDRLVELLDVTPESLAPDGLPAISKRGANSLTAWLTAQGVWNCDAASKHVPAEVFQYTRPKLALFLNRLFACDGSVFFSGSRPTVSYSTVSECFARQIQHLLLRFGILAKLRWRTIKYKDQHRPAYELQITQRDSLRVFIDEVGAFGKETAISQVRAKLQSTAANTNLDVIPSGVWSDLIRLKGNRSWRSIYRELEMPLDSNFHVGKRGLSRERLATLNHAFNSPRLDDLAHSDVFWDRIVSIEPVGIKRVFDLTVPDTHNFVANDMIVHNTSLMLNIALNAARKHHQRVAIFSLEMSNEQIVQRLVSAETGIDSQRLRTGDLDDQDWPLFVQATSALSDTLVFVDDTPSITALQLRTKARRLYAEHGLDLIIIDYLQLMSGEARSENRVQEISYLSRSLKALARELNVPVLVASQLSRAVEQRSDKKPVLSDLRESGSIEQDADIVMFIYREDVYDENSDRKNIAELIIAKHRNGPTGTIELFFQKNLTQFKNALKRDVAL